MATEVTGVEVQEVSDDVAKEYLGLVLHKLSGTVRNEFLPEITRIEDMSKIYGTKASTTASTGKLLPALEYILNNTTFQLEGMMFAKKPAKESLQKKSVINGLIKNKYLAEYPSLQKTFNKIVKPAPSVKRGESVKGTPPKQIHARREIEQFLKVISTNKERSKEFNELVGKTVVRRYAMSSELRETLIAEKKDGKVSKFKVDMKIIDEENLEHIFGAREDVVEMDADMRAALKRMKPSKIMENSYEPLPTDVDILQSLFSEVIANPYEILMDELKEISQDKQYHSKFGRISQTKVQQKMNEDLEFNVLKFPDLVYLLARLERVLFGGGNFGEGISRKLRNIYTKSRHGVEDLDEKQKELKQEVQEKYPKIRNEFISRLKEKIGEVLSEPIMHDKSGFQPYTWLTEDKGIGA